MSVVLYHIYHLSLHIAPSFVSLWQITDLYLWKQCRYTNTFSIFVKICIIYRTTYTNTQIRRSNSPIVSICLCDIHIINMKTRIAKFAISIHIQSQLSKPAMPIKALNHSRALLCLCYALCCLEAGGFCMSKLCKGRS